MHRRGKVERIEWKIIVDLGLNEHANRLGSKLNAQKIVDSKCLKLLAFSSLRLRGEMD